VIAIPGFPVERVQQPGRHVRLETLPHGVMRLVLARPEVRNAFDAVMISEISAALGVLMQVPHGAELRVLLLQGEGGTFCAGGDLAYMQAQAAATPEENLDDARALGRMFHRLAALPVPVLCHVQGAAIGGGLGLAACSDHVLADAAAFFATSEVRLGLVPGLISPYVVRRLGVAHAAPLLLAGQRANAAEALRIGLVQRVLGSAEVAGEVLAGLLGQFLAAGPEAARRTKALLLQVSPLPDAELREFTARAISEARASAEGQEGLRAFFEKVPPRWVP
jgi:methylglutaconyl-CoA hydratase